MLSHDLKNCFFLSVFHPTRVFPVWNKQLSISVKQRQQKTELNLPLFKFTLTFDVFTDFNFVWPVLSAVCDESLMNFITGLYQRIYDVSVFIYLCISFLKDLKSAIRWRSRQWLTAEVIGYLWLETCSCYGSDEIFIISQSCLTRCEQLKTINVQNLQAELWVPLRSRFSPPTAG